MTMKLGPLNQWRDYFQSANSDIFEIIDHAIMVAASDCPKEFRLRRDGIAERLFNCMLPRCLGCDRVELAVSDDASKESKVNCSREENENENEDDHGEMDQGNPVSNYSFGDAEALTDEIEQESQYLAEVLRIKDILFNRQEQVSFLFFLF